MTGGPPLFVWISIAAGASALGMRGVRGALALRTALRDADLRELDRPAGWPVTRAFFGLCAALPVMLVVPGFGFDALGAAGVVGALGFAVAPLFLASLRGSVEREILDDLPLHLDLMALAMESGSSLPTALALTAEHGPAGALRRALADVLLDLQAGTEPLEALRSLDQRLGLRSISTLVMSLRTAERLVLPLAPVLRDRATQSAANRFARAERRARAAPLKLWATLMLCIAPCTLVVLAFPAAHWLARLLS